MVFTSMSSLLVVAAVCTTVTSSTNPTTFKAAVYSYTPYNPGWQNLPKTRYKALEMMNTNLDVFKEQAKLAKEKGAQIIVFPEDGIYGLQQTRKTMLHFLETIPDPKIVNWNPCNDPYRYSNTEVQQTLSCMAKEHKMYVVANMGNYVSCSVYYDVSCPKDGRYQYNTNVAYDSEGKLVARYHKVHLFYEYQFDTPESEVIYFDTPFGRFGLLTCFDLVFKDPTIKMLQGHNVTNIAFPTAWYDGLPLMTAVGFHSSFSRGMGVNFLDANYQLPGSRFHGSGIYTPDGTASFYYNSSTQSTGKLMVSTLNILQPNSFDFDSVTKRPSNVDIGFNYFETDPKAEFESVLFHDKYTFRKLELPSGAMKVCQNNVCCTLEYSLSGDTISQSQEETFAFGVFDGLNTHLGSMYIQVCVLVKCADDGDLKSCGTSTKVSKTKFESFTITGEFQTEYVFPQVIMVDQWSGELLLGNKSSWSYKDSVITTEDNWLDSPLISAGMIARDYSRD